MRFIKVVPVVLATLALAAFSMAGNVTGKWKGKVTLEADKATMAKIKAAGQDNLPSVVLEFKADKTYSAVQSGGPDPKPHTAEGTWSQDGNKVTVSPKKRDGRAVTGEAAKSKYYIVSKDGSTMTLDLSAQMKQPTKGADGKPIPKVTVKVVLHKMK
jgi:lipopolysaccharide export system protein LptA